MEHSSWLLTSLVYLGAAVLAVPLARLLGLGAIIGYLVAGIAIGPWGLRLVTEPKAMLDFAEFGVVLMLFLVGLELEPKRLWALRRPIFGWGSLQLLGSTALMLAVGLAFGVDWRLALLAGLGLAMSSTAIGLGVLAERNLMPTPAGQSVLAVSLLQDIAAIPVLAIVPLLALAPTLDAPSTDAAAGITGSAWFGAAKALGVIALIVFGGRLLLRPALRWIARSDTPEIFTAAALLLVLATAALADAVGLSMALGAFLAGVLLAESEYRRQLETDIAPFKGLLLGLFFIAVGMGIDFAVVARQPWLVVGVVLGFLTLKAALLWAMAWRMRLPLAERPLFTVLLAQGGEFGFVVFQGGAQAGAISAEAASLLVAAVAISMLITPLLLLAADRWWAPHLARLSAGARPAEFAEPQDAPVIIAGYGRYGQVVGRLLNANGLAATVLEHDADQVETIRRFGWKVFYGDATRLDLLRVAGAASAKVFVLAIDDVEQSMRVAALVRQHFPHLVLVARARNITHYTRLRQLGLEAQWIERETFDSALMSGRSVLQALGWQPYAARTQALRYRLHTIALIEQMLPHLGDEQKLIAVSKQGRQQLETMWAAERAAAVADRARQNWHDGDEPPA